VRRGAERDGSTDKGAGDAEPHEGGDGVSRGSGDGAGAEGTGVGAAGDAFGGVEPCGAEQSVAGAFVVGGGDRGLPGADGVGVVLAEPEPFLPVLGRLERATGPDGAGDHDDQLQRAAAGERGPVPGISAVHGPEGGATGGGGVGGEPTGRRSTRRRRR